MSDLSISNIIQVSVSESGAGAGEYNTSNIGLFTREAYELSFGSSGYKLYKSPTDVATDFGTGSKCYAMANKIFSQKPNILANNGYLAIIPFVDTTDVTEIQKVSFSAVPAAGSFKLKYGLLLTAAIAYTDDAAAVQVALRALSGLSSVTVAGSFTAGFTVTFTGVTGAATLLTFDENSLQDSGPENVLISVAVLTAGTTASTETIDAAITRTVGLVQYFGIMETEIPSEDEMLDAADVVQALDKIMFQVSYTSADVEVGGKLDLLRSGNYSHTRGLYYGGNATTALGMMAAYAGRALSVNFGGSNTTMTMHLKDLQSVQVDTSLTETLLAKCQAAGVDVYGSFEGVAKVFCSGLNEFFDDVYNLLWFVGAIKIAGFNILAQTSTKIVQTEDGVSTLKGAYRKVCEQGLVNQYMAPGEWTLPNTFGIQEDFFANIRQRGYYIYSVPVALQSAADREDRKAPVISIAAKLAGAIHSSSLIVNINK